MIDSTYRQQLRGRIVSYHLRERSGVIAGADGLHYGFFAEAWRESVAPAPGMEVDFVASDGRATSVHLLGGVPGSGYAPGGAAVRVYPKSKVAAALLALFLGQLGVHKFYLGYTGEGFILLGGFIASLILLIVIVGVFGLIALNAIALVEFVLYLTKTDEEFHQMYVVGRKPWF